MVHQHNAEPMYTVLIPCIQLVSTTKVKSESVGLRCVFYHAVFPIFYDDVIYPVIPHLLVVEHVGNCRPRRRLTS